MTKQQKNAAFLTIFLIALGAVFSFYYYYSSKGINRQLKVAVVRNKWFVLFLL